MSRFRGSADSTYKSLAGKRVLITGMAPVSLYRRKLKLLILC